MAKPSVCIEILEEALRSYVGHDQVTWDEYLVPLEVAINSAESGSTHMTPWYFNHGYHPYLPIDIGRMATHVPAVNTYSHKIYLNVLIMRVDVSQKPKTVKSLMRICGGASFNLQQGQLVRLQLATS